MAKKPKTQANPQPQTKGAKGEHPAPAPKNARGAAKASQAALADPRSLRDSLSGVVESIRAAESILDALTYGSNSWPELQQRATATGFRSCYTGEDCEGYIKRARQHAARVLRDRLFGSARDLCIEHPDLPSLPGRSEDPECDLREALGTWCIDALRRQTAVTSKSSQETTLKEPPAPLSSTESAQPLDVHSSLLALSEHPTWPIDELPSGVGISTLRVLDDEGWIQARASFYDHADPGRPSLQHLPWFSPMREPQSYPGGWDMVMNQHLEAKGRLPYEVRISEAGLAALARGKPHAQGGAGRNQQGRPDSDDGDENYRPGKFFGKALTSRLRKATAPNRVTMCVRKRMIGKTVCYHLGDVERNWGPFKK